MGLMAQLMDGAVRSAYAQGAAGLPPPVVPQVMLVRGPGAGAGALGTACQGFVRGSRWVSLA